MQDLNVVIAGAAGEGIQTIGEIVSRTVLAQGYAAFTWQEYESRIRGGQNSYAIRISDRPHNAPLLEADVLLALNEGAVEKYLDFLSAGGSDHPVSILKRAGVDMMSAEPFEKTMETMVRAMDEIELLIRNPSLPEKEMQPSHAVSGNESPAIR